MATKTSSLQRREQYGFHLLPYPGPCRQIGKKPNAICPDRDAVFSVLDPTFTLFNIGFNFCIGGPDKSIAEGVNQAVPGDRLQIKAGNYDETIRITKAVTLATDRGTVAIGRP